MKKLPILLLASASLGLGASANAEIVGYNLNHDLTAGAYTVSLDNDTSYTFSVFPSPSSGTIGVATGGDALVFGNGFLNQGRPDGLQQGVTVPDQLSLGEFFATNGTAGIPYSLALDYVALEFTMGGATHYGYAEVGGTSLYRLAYNTDANGSIVTGQDFRALPSPAVPEPATWAMMIAGFGFVGAGLRRARMAPLAA